MGRGGIEVLVAGSGVMGRGIAASFARAGIATAVLSRRPEAVEGLDPAVAVLGALPEAAPELIVESIPEVEGLKLALYAKIERRYGGRPVLGSNTSGLSPEALAAPLGHPERFLGIHYFQPADVAPLVEVARVAKTADAALATAVRLLEASGRSAIVLNEPIAGLLINRLQHAILHEAYYLIERGICTAADVDQVAKLLLGPRMSVTGLIEQKDISGLDTHALAQAAIVPELFHGASPSRAVQDKYAGGRIGVKTGTGFYDWRGMDVAGYRAWAAGLLGRVLALLEAERRPAPPLSADDGK